MVNNTKCTVSTRYSGS